MTDIVERLRDGYYRIPDIGPEAADEIERLRGELATLVDRIEKFIDRRMEDDGPDWEYTKLSDQIKSAAAALEGKD